MWSVVSTTLHGVLSILAFKKSHLHARKQNDVVVAEFARLLACRRAVHEWIVVRLAAVDMDDEITVGTTRDCGDLYTRSSQCRERLVQLELASRERTAEHLELCLR